MYHRVLTGMRDAKMSHKSRKCYHYAENYEVQYCTEYLLSKKAQTPKTAADVKQVYC